MSKADEPPDLRAVSDEEYQLNLLYPGESITVAFLNGILDNYNLKKTGRKQQKINRLVQHLYGNSNLGFEDDNHVDTPLDSDSDSSDSESDDDSESGNGLEDNDERSVAESSDAESSDDADNSDDANNSDDERAEDSPNEPETDINARVSSDDSASEFPRSNFPGSSVPKLKAMCRELGLKGYSNKRRPELVDMLNGFLAD